MLNREINSGGLVVTAENHDVERDFNSTRKRHITVVKTSSWSFSLPNILMVIGGVVGVSAMSVGLNFALRAWMKNGKRARAGRSVINMEAASAPQLELGFHGNAGAEEGAAGAGQLELGFLGNADADGNANINRQIILSFPTYSKEDMFQ